MARMTGTRGGDAGSGAGAGGSQEETEGERLEGADLQEAWLH